MKKLTLTLVLFLSFLFLSTLQAEELSPYLHVAKVKGSMKTFPTRVEKALEAKGFSILGKYHPEGNQDMLVIAYTRKDLYNTVLRVKSRGVLASVLKISLYNKNGVIDVAMINPDYIFHAYLREHMKTVGADLSVISNDAKAAMKTIGSNLKAFGGNVSVTKLHKYKYMVGMQTFNDPTLLATFSSFEEGLKIINNNLDKGKASTEKVYSVTFKTSKVAMFGVGLNSKEKGEAHFLPIIGEDHIAAMTY